MVFELLRFLELSPSPKSGHLGCQEKEEIKGLQKNLGSAESKTGQGLGTLDEKCRQDDFWGLPHGRLDAKWDISGTNRRR